MLAKDRNDLGEGILRAHVLVGRIAIVVTALAIVGYAWEVSIWRGTWSDPSRLGGGTPVGLASGTVAGLIVLFEMLLWPRKALRRFRLVRTKYWMVAHVWFGLAVVPICFVHCGFVSGGVVTTVFLVGIFVTATNSKSGTHLKGNAQQPATTPVATGWARPSHLNFWLLSFVISSIAFISFSSMFLDSVFGGLFTTLFLFLTVLTVASGVYGWSMQKSLPRDMMHQVPSETIYSQIDQTLETYLSDTETYLSLACGNRPGTKETEVTRFESDDLRMVAAPTVASHERIQGKSLQTEMVRGSHEDRERLWDAYAKIYPFIKRGNQAETPVTHRWNASQFFAELRSSCQSSNLPSVEKLEALCEQRRQLDRQRVLHARLHGWLPLHFVLSIAVTIFLAVHVVTALRYW